MVLIGQVLPQGKGKYHITFDDGMSCVLYRSEMRSLGICENGTLSEEQYEKLLTEILGKRCKKRALHLLEQMDRTEKQLREKLLSNEYPECCVDAAIRYVKQFHYLDDYRFACNYIRCSGGKLSERMLRQKLAAKGVRRDDIQSAIDAEYTSEEYQLILDLLHKKQFDADEADEKEWRRMYQFLMRRGFGSSDVLKAMRCQNCTISSCDM